MRIHLERGPAWLLQIGPGLGPMVWLTVWAGGATITLPRRWLLCLRAPTQRAYYSERNGIGVRKLLNVAGWRLFIREPLDG